jgi:iron complex outermembrane receptor protein
MRRKLLLLFVMLITIGGPVFAQKITGLVVSKTDGQPLVGMSIKIKDTKAGTTTDVQGKYSLTASPQSTLIFTFIGYKTQEVLVSGRSVVNVEMEEDASQLSEVVVTALGVKKDQKSLGYATNTIKSEAITRTGSPNFASALYGKAPGVRIASAPGGATSAVNITIRGTNSITGKSQPLIVMDGVPIRDGEVKNNDYWNDQRIRGNGLLDVNPEDIENISILKGASAAALYGSEAVNGVVLITTKSGKGKKGFSVDFSANYSVDKIAFLPRYQNVRGQGYPTSIANAGQNAEGFVYYDTNGDGVKETRGLIGTSLNFGPKFDGQPVLSWDGVVRPYVSQGDNFAGLFQEAHSSNVNFAVSQASENANIRFSLTHQENQGLSMGSQNNKNVANLNTSFKLGKKYTADLVVNYVNQYTHNRPYAIDRMMNNFTGMMPRFDNAAWYLNKYKTSLGYRFVTGSNQSLTPDENIKYGGFRGDIADYVWSVKEKNEDEYSNRVIASMTHNIQITDDLKLRGRLATDFTSMKTESKQSTEIPLAFGNSGYFGMKSNLYNILYGDVLLTYAKKLSEDFHLTAMAGYTATKETSSYLERGTSGGLSTENLFDVAASVNTPVSNSSRTSLVKDAFIGTVNVDYKGFLFLEGTLRRDRTSTMNPNNNTFVYPSVNSSFVFSEAFTLPRYFSYGKVRASWGIVGNYPSLYSANIAYQQNTYGIQQTGGKSVLYTTLPSAFGNDLIKPEQKHEFEFGLETKFFNNRLGLDVSYYNARIVDQILPLTLAPTSGAVSVLSNIGILRNEGLEVAITGTPVKTPKFMWETGINFASNRNVVEQLANGSTELLHADYDGNAAQLRSVVGQPMGDFYVHPIATNDKGEKIVDESGLYVLDNDKMVKAGNAMPKLTGGFTNTFSYKGFTLDVLADFRWGGYIMPTGLNWMISRGLLEESTKYMDAASGGLRYYIDANGRGVQTTANAGPNGQVVYNDGMLMDGVSVNGEKNTNVISQAVYYFNTYNWGGPQYSSSRYELYVQENSYIKLRELSLGYNVPAAIARKIGAKKVNVSVFGRNLLYIYRTIKDMDSEQTTAGSRWFETLTNTGTNPATRTLGFMVRASF